MTDELPTVVAVLSLKPHGGRLPRKPRLIQSPQRQVAVDRRATQHPLRCFDQPLGGFHAVVFQQLNGATGGKMPTLLIGEPAEFGKNRTLRFSGHP